MGKSIFEKVRCNICGSDDYIVLFEDRYGKGKRISENDIMLKFKSSGDETLVDRVVRCKKCGLAYINPRINTNLILKGYSEGEDERFVSQAKGREATFAKSLRLIEKHIKRKNGKKGKILDVGTAGGSFLHVAKRAGWEVHGVEPNRWLCDWGKKHYGIDIKPGTIFDHTFSQDSFDVVTLWDVLEHTPDPKKVLEECRRLLKKDGLLVINYPDIGSWIARLMGRRWVFLLSVHLFYFSRKTMRDILGRLGFEVVVFRPHFQMLGLGYLARRMNAYSKTLSRAGSFLAGALHIENVQIPYWLGQTLVIARKI